MENKSSIGSIIATIIIIAIIILGGLYFWGKRIEESKKLPSSGETATTTVIIDKTQNEASAIRAVGSSDDTDAIQSAIDSTKLDGLDKEISQ
jgi:hypothetical protein